MTKSLIDIYADELRFLLKPKESVSILNNRIHDKIALIAMEKTSESPDLHSNTDISQTLITLLARISFLCEHSIEIWRSGPMETYRAILKGNRLEWTDSQPTDLEAEQPVEVTILDAPDDVDATTQGKRMAKALERLAATNAFADIKDPVAWQREIRKDRPLPGRDE